jgi:DNA-binding Lrp family transcriptional regulator
MKSLHARHRWRADLSSEPELVEGRVRRASEVAGSPRPPFSEALTGKSREHGKLRRFENGIGVKGTNMVTAIVLLKIDHNAVTGTAEKILEIPAVSDVYSVSGRFDLLVIIKCESVDMIEYVITDALLKTDGIKDSETMFAFRSYDKREAGRSVDVD